MLLRPISSTRSRFRCAVRKISADIVTFKDLSRPKQDLSGRTCRTIQAIRQKSHLTRASHGVPKVQRSKSSHFTSESLEIAMKLQHFCSSLCTSMIFQVCQVHKSGRPAADLSSPRSARPQRPAPQAEAPNTCRQAAMPRCGWTTSGNLGCVGSVFTRQKVQTPIETEIS